MQIVEIAALDNGAHRNQTSDIITIPEGWAKVPEDMQLENFPFGEVTAEEIDGVMTVTGWIAGEIPEPEPEPQGESLEERVDALENAIAEGLNLYEGDLSNE